MTLHFFGALAKDSEDPDKCLRKAMSEVKNKLTKQKSRLINSNCTLTEILNNKKQGLLTIIVQM